MTNKMPKIKGFHNSLYHLNAVARGGDFFTYVPKVKMHGTNAAIRIDLNGTITAQKRTDDITPDNDNAGFAAFVEEHIKPKIFLDKFMMDIFWPKINNGLEVTIDEADPPNITIMGEWVGPGVQKGVAIAEIPEKVFMPFAVFINTKAYNGNHRVCYCGPDWDWFVEAIEDISPRIKCLNIMTDKAVRIYPHDQDKLHKTVERMNRDILDVEEECPASKQFFDVSGVGEGFVYYPVLEYGARHINKHELELYGFKVKGEKHATNKAGKPARVRSKIPDSAYQFADFHVTPARIKQGIQAVCPEPDRKYLGKLIGWVCKDISEECQIEIEESGLDWKKQLSGVIATSVRNAYFEHLNELAIGGWSES